MEESCTCHPAQEEEFATVTLTLEDNKEVTCAILTIFDVNDHSYIALLPLNEQGEENGEVYLYRYIETDDEPQLENIEEDDEYEACASAFDEWLNTLEATED